MEAHWNRENFFLQTAWGLYPFLQPLTVYAQTHTPDIVQPSNQCQMIGGKLAVLILDWQDRWQLTVKINLCSRSTPSEGCLGSAGSKVSPLLLLMLLLIEVTPPTQKTRKTPFFLLNTDTSCAYMMLIMHMVGLHCCLSCVICRTLVAVKESLALQQRKFWLRSPVYFLHASDKPLTWRHLTSTWG